MEKFVTMDEAKRTAAKSLKDAIGMQFQTPTGVTGTVIEQVSARGKVQAELSCSEANCTETHIREVSDWHQCGKCRTHKKSKSRGGGSGGVGVSSGDGNVLREQKILETDDAETRATKEEINALVKELKERETADRKAKQEAAALERKAKQEEEKARKDAERLEAQKKALAARKEQIRALAEQRGVKVSEKTEAEIAETEAELEEQAG